MVRPMDFTFIRVTFACFSFIITCHGLMNVQVEENRSTELICEVEDLPEGFGPHTEDSSPRRWQVQHGKYLTNEGEILEHPRRISFSSIDAHEYILKIEDVEIDDRNVYECIWDDQVVKSLQLIVLYAPKLYNSSAVKVNATAGERVSLFCYFDAMPQASVQWIFIDENDFNVEKISNSSELVLESVDISSMGKYECLAQNGIRGIREDRFSISLDIHMPPLVMSPHSQVMQVLGRDTMLQCVVTSYPLADTTWHFKKVPLELSNRIRVEHWKISAHTFLEVLFLNEVRDADYGTYQCSASNELGTSSAFMTLMNIAAVKVQVEREVVVALEGSSQVIECGVDSAATDGGVSWFSHSLLLPSQLLYQTSNPRIKLAPRFAITTHQALWIKHVSYGEAANYCCLTASGKNHSTDLVVTGEAICTWKYSALDNHQVTLVCSLRYAGTSSSWWSVSWQHNGKHVSTSRVLDSENELHRELLVNRSHAVYVCHISSQHYVTTCSTTFQGSVSTLIPKSNSNLWMFAVIAFCLLLLGIFLILSIVLGSCLGRYRSKYTDLRRKIEGRPKMRLKNHYSERVSLTASAEQLEQQEIDV